MADPRFYSVAGPFTLQKLAEIADAEIAPGGEPGRRFSDVAPLDSAGADDVAFLDNRRYADAFAKSTAGACLIAPKMASRAPEGMNILLTEEPYHAYGRVADAFYPTLAQVPDSVSEASIDPSANFGPDCRIDPGVVIGPGAEIGARCHIGPNATIGHGVVLGSDCRIGASASVSYCLAGDRVVIHPGVRIGQDGFGFALGPRGHTKIPQLGRVLIGNDIEIGANTTIDRGTGPDTVIGDGTRIDNLVQIAHNVRLGKNCIVVAQVGISGSTEIGDFVMIAGQVGLAGHLKIGDGAQIAAQSGVMRDIPAGTAVAGSPAVPAREYWRQVAWLAASAKQSQED